MPSESAPMLVMRDRAPDPSASSIRRFSTRRIRMTKVVYPNRYTGNNQKHF
jgi:hypothetical protein